MTAANHVVAGAVIATAFKNPVVALPLAFMSHFLLDALPHYGIKDHTTPKFVYILSLDFAVATSFLLALALLQPQGWQYFLLAAVVSASPDLMWLPRWINELRSRENRPLRGLSKLHSSIQWSERPWGALIEVAAFVLGVYVFLTLSA